jgi:hypothetical protein
LKKAAQKLLRLWARGVSPSKPPHQANQSFLLLFFKKEALPFLLPGCSECPLT